MIFSLALAAIGVWLFARANRFSTTPDSLEQSGASPAHETMAPTKSDVHASGSNPELENQAGTKPSSPATDAGQPNGSELNRQLAPLKRVIPTADQVRDQVKKNPHVTPKAILTFALELGERLDASVASQGEAEKFMRELEQCVTEESDSRVASARALCLLNARRLSKSRPELRNDYLALESRSPQELVKLSKVAE